MVLIIWEYLGGFFWEFYVENFPWASDWIFGRFLLIFNLFDFWKVFEDFFGCFFGERGDVLVVIAGEGGALTVCLEDQCGRQQLGRAGLDKYHNH